MMIPVKMALMKTMILVRTTKMSHYDDNEDKDDYGKEDDGYNENDDRNKDNDDENSDDNLDEYS